MTDFNVTDAVRRGCAAPWWERAGWLSNLASWGNSSCASASGSRHAPHNVDLDELQHLARAPSQQASDRRQPAGGGQVQNQPSQQAEDLHAGIVAEEVIWKEKFPLSRPHTPSLWRSGRSRCCFKRKLMRCCFLFALTSFLYFHFLCISHKRISNNLW